MAGHAATPSLGAQAPATPAVSLSPPTGASGTDVVVTIDGAQPGVPIVVAHEGGTEIVTTDDSGAAVASFVPSGCAPERVVVRLLVDPAGPALFLEAGFTIESPACRVQQLQAGDNLLVYGGPTLPVEAALGALLREVVSIWEFDEALQEWNSWFADAPASIQGVVELVHGQVYLVSASQALEWSYALPLPPFDDRLSTALVAGTNVLRYAGPSVAVERALNASAASVLAVWRLDPVVQSWSVWSPALPDDLQGFSTLRYGEPYVIVSESAVTWSYADFAIGPDEADALVISEVVRPGSLSGELIVFRHPAPLSAGDVVRPHAGDGGFSVEAPAYVYWLDAAPGALFTHPTRFVLVDRSDGSIRTSDEEWWPELNGERLFQDPGVYWDAGNWVFSQLLTTRPPASLLASGTAAPLGNGGAQPAQVPAGECAIIVNGTVPGDPPSTVDQALATDTAGFAAFVEEAGYAHVEVVEPPDNTSLDLYGAVARAATNPDCQDVTLVFETHGARNRLLVGGDILTADQVAALLALFDQVTYKVLIEACYSGSFVDELTALSNVAIVVTATDANSVAKADQDYTEEDRGIFVFDVADPNPEDEGSEFMSGFLEDLSLLMGDADAVMSMSEAAAESSIGFVPVLYHCAFESAVAKDFDALNGDTKPQRSLDLTVQRIVGVGQEGVPIFGAVPYECPKPPGFEPPAGPGAE